MLRPRFKQHKPNEKCCVTVCTQTAMISMPGHQETCLDVGYNHPEALAQQVSVWLADKPRRALILTLSEDYFVTETLTAPAALSETLRQAFIRTKFAALFGESDHCFYWDYNIVTHTAAHDTLCVTAASNTTINTLQKAFSQQQLTLACITTKNGDKALNLLPWRDQRAQKSRYRRHLLLLINGVSVALLAGGLQIGLVQDTRYQKRALTALQQQFSDLHQHTLPDQHVFLKILQTAHRAKIAAQKSNAFSRELLRTVADVLPETLTLTHLSLDTHRITLQGIGPSEAIQQYRTLLQERWKLHSVKLLEIHQATPPQFTLQSDFYEK